MRLIDADALDKFLGDEPDVPDTNVGDTISRQAAIDVEDDK